MPETRAERRSLFNRAHARDLRNNSTGPERYLWKILGQLRSEELKFRRQQPIGQYIVDFLCPALKIIVELDGRQHDQPETAIYDQQRTQWLEEQGYNVLRFQNIDVIRQRHVVVDGILAAVNQKRLASGMSPFPKNPSDFSTLPQGGG
jgi:very-short-patch-repair endonuclease